jgi:hypothetical protein
MAMVVELKRHQFTVEEYHRMGEVGILTEDDRVQLIEGVIVEMLPLDWDMPLTSLGFLRTSQSY